MDLVVQGRLRSLIVFQVLVVGGGLAIGSLTAPDGWYADLAKPAFNPPAWVFGPVWTVIYICTAFAGWRIWGWRPRVAARLASRLWFTQLGLNFLWTPLFFRLHLPGTALIVLLFLLMTIVALILIAWPKDRITASLLAPYALWVAFAGVLNVSIVVLN